MTSDAELFGLTVAQSAEEEHREAGRGHGLLLSKTAVRNDEEAANYTAEIMSLTAKVCHCGTVFMGTPDEMECAWCVQEWRDHQDEVAVALAATNGTL